jgi:hypothetical protein
VTSFLKGGVVSFFSIYAHNPSEEIIVLWDWRVSSLKYAELIVRCDFNMLVEWIWDHKRGNGPTITGDEKQY